MKTIKLLGIIMGFIALQSCYKPGEIQIQNNISKAEIINVEWGDILIASELIPGQSSNKIEITKRMKKLPSTQKISFTMRANGQTVFLRTNDSYALDEDDFLHIILNDDTPVYNPNP